METLAACSGCGYAVPLWSPKQVAPHWVCTPTAGGDCVGGRRPPSDASPKPKPEGVTIVSKSIHGSIGVVESPSSGKSPAADSSLCESQLTSLRSDIAWHMEAAYTSVCDLAWQASMRAAVGNKAKADVLRAEARGMKKALHIFERAIVNASPNLGNRVIGSGDQTLGDQRGDGGTSNE